MIFRRVLTFAIVFVCFALLLWSGFQNRYHRQPDIPSMSVTQAEPATAQETDAVTSPLLGKLAPDFALRDLSGRKVELADYRGKAVLINFWATWCAPCQVEMPWFIELERKYASQGFTILGIDQDFPEDLPQVPGFAEKMNLNYPVLYGDKKTYDAYGCCDYLPMSYYIDRQGVVRIATVGLSSRDTVDTYIRRVLEARPSARPDTRVTATAAAPPVPPK